MNTISRIVTKEATVTVGEKGHPLATVLIHPLDYACQYEYVQKLKHLFLNTDLEKLHVFEYEGIADAAVTGPLLHPIVWSYINALEHDRGHAAKLASR